MSKLTLLLRIISQEKKLLETEATSVSVPSVTGELTILPEHIALFTQLDAGELRYSVDNTEHLFVISRGFLDVSPHGEVTVIVDAATDAREISLEKAQEAVRKAQETMTNTSSKEELVMAEAELKRALLEIKIAQKTKKSTI